MIKSAPSLETLPIELRSPAPEPPAEFPGTPQAMADPETPRDRHIPVRDIPGMCALGMFVLIVSLVRVAKSVTGIR